MPIHALDWTGSHLLVGSRNGITQLYAVRHDDNTENMLRLILIAEYTAPPKQVCITWQQSLCNDNLHEPVVHGGSIRSQQLPYQQYHPFSILCTAIFT